MFFLHFFIVPIYSLLHLYYLVLSELLIIDKSVQIIGSLNEKHMPTSVIKASHVCVVYLIM
jgi:hypothetical protein